MTGVDSEIAGRDQPRPRGGGNRRITLLLRDVLVIFVVAVLVSFLIKTFVARSFYIPSGSMENTLLIQDRVIVNELEPGLVPVSRGDVVVFKDPGGWLPAAPPKSTNPIAAGFDAALQFVGLSASDSEQHLVKRVIGLPGDHVVCCNTLGQVSVNGSPLKEPYVVIPPGEVNAAAVPFDVTVPRDRLWVMGDNRYNSQDSSKNQALPGKGFVPVEDVVGRAFVVSWPLNRWGWLDDYPQVFRGVPKPK